MSAEVVKRFVSELGQRYSIRRHANGTFQAYHDNPFEGANQGYQDDERPVGGLFSDVEGATAELLRNPSHNWLLTECLYKDGNKS
jgi:hypothetical protein